MKYLFNDSINPKTGKQNHLHTLDMEDGKGPKRLTGTSSVENVLFKVLSWWASGLAVGTLGWVKKLNPKYDEVTPEEIIANDKERKKSAMKMLKKIRLMKTDEYVELLDNAYKAHSVKLDTTAKAGTDLHAELEHWVRSQMGIGPTKDYDPKIKPFTDWANKNVKKFLWSEAHCFDEELWVGGISDAGAEMLDGTLSIIDFKSAKEAYATSFIQTAGYAIQMEKNGLWDSKGRVNKKLDQKVSGLIVVPFGSKVVEPSIRFNVEEFKDGFRWCVGLYRLLGLEKNS